MYSLESFACLAMEKMLQALSAMSVHQHLFLSSIQSVFILARFLDIHKACITVSVT